MSATSSPLFLPVSDRDHVRGPSQARVTLLEYGDYECPDCASAHRVIETVRGRAGDGLRFAYRHFPLSNRHPHAERAAEAAEASGSQGRFWPMHDLLFAGQDALEDQDLVDRARALGLNLNRFVHDLGSGFHAERVQEDFMSGVRSGVHGTPSFYVNGERYEGPSEAEALLGAIERASRSL